MPTELELAWLAGFCDADGCIRLKKGMKNGKLGQNSLIPHIAFHNTCLVSMNRIWELLLAMDMIPTTSAKKNGCPSKWASLKTVDVMGMKRCEPLLEKLLPHLVTKKLEAELLLLFIARRKSRGVRNKPYEPQDYLTYQAIKYLKTCRHLRDYTLTVQEVLDQDIVRSSAKVVEEAEMSSRLSTQEIAERAKNLIWYRKDRSQGAPTSPK